MAYPCQLSDMALLGIPSATPKVPFPCFLHLPSEKPTPHQPLNPNPPRSCSLLHTVAWIECGITPPPVASSQKARLSLFYLLPFASQPPPTTLFPHSSSSPKHNHNPTLAFRDSKVERQQREKEPSLARTKPTVPASGQTQAPPHHVEQLEQAQHPTHRLRRPFPLELKPRCPPTRQREEHPYEHDGQCQRNPGSIHGSRLYHRASGHAHFPEPTRFHHRPCVR